jgi:hypothetical protein
VHPGMQTIFRAVQQELAQTQSLLQQQAERFNQTFQLSAEEQDALRVCVEIHGSGGAVELFAADQDVVFSLRSGFDPETGGDRWELIAYHGVETLPNFVASFSYRPSSSEYARRVRGARLIAAVGQYLAEMQRGSLPSEEPADVRRPVFAMEGTTRQQIRQRTPAVAHFAMQQV